MLAAWPVLVILLMWIDRRHGDAPLFLAYAYIASLAVNHWFGGLVHSFPWKPFINSADTVSGFEEATLGLAAFVAGAAMLPKVLVALAERKQSANRGGAAEGGRIATILVVTGVLSFVASSTVIASLPSMGAILSGGQQMLIAGLCLKCWLAWQINDKRVFTRWLALAFMFPIYTTLFQGFLGYGIAFLMTILIFIGTFYRPRWHVFGGAVLGVLIGLSVYASYASNRDNIRAQVWGGQAMENRFEALGKMLDEMGPFDFTNPRHLMLVDLRLNQNQLVGAGIHYVPDFHDYANGETLYMALIALVPRALWPDKPVTAGSMGLVSVYTGIQFAGSTSVGIGQVLEFYINFGHPGVIVGFFILGLMIRYIDLRLSKCLRQGAWNEVGLWFGVGAAALNPLGQLVEVTASMGAAALVGVVLVRYSESRAAGQHAIRARDINNRQQH